MNDKPERLHIYTDGASRGNPGDAAWAYLVLDRNRELITSQAGYMGRGTNNQAEYYAVIRAVQRAEDLTNKKVNLFSDSQLLVNQVTGKWKVKDGELYRLYRRIRGLVANFEEVSFTHLPREDENIARADRLCNHRLDQIEKYQL